MKTSSLLSRGLRAAKRGLRAVFNRAAGVFYRGLNALGRGLTSIFNCASGNKALADRGLVRGNGNTIAGAAGLTLSSMVPLVTAACLIPVIGLPLAAIFATATAIGGILIPSRLEAKALKDKTDRCSFYC